MRGSSAANLWSSLPFVWQEYGLVRPVTRSLRDCPGRRRLTMTWTGQWRGTNAALASGTPLDRVRVRYDNGLTVWANSRARDLTVPLGDRRTLTLPQFGWLAQGNGLLAYTAWRDGVVADYAETPDSLFADARTAVPGPKPPLRVTPGVSAVHADRPARFHDHVPLGRAGGRPRRLRPLRPRHRASATQAEGIAFQFGDSLPAPDTWPVGQAIQGTPVGRDAAGPI